MASVSKRTRNGKTSWVVRWRDPASAERKRSFARAGEAERYRTSIEHEMLTGGYVDPAAGRISLRDYVDTRWRPAQVHLRASTLDNYGSHLRNHVLPELGDRPLASIRRGEVKIFVTGLSARLAPATVHTVVAVLRSIMASAVDDERIVANPCLRVPLPRVERPTVEPLPPEAVRALASVITDRYAVAVWLAAGAGLREGEVLGLRVPRVDFLRRRVHVEQQVQSVNGAAPVLCPLKTRASRRVVPVDDVVLTAVSEHMRRWPPGPDGLLITNRCGRAVRRSSFGHCWQEAVAAVGLPRGTRFHDLRHFYASTLIGAGLHPKTIQVRLGHASIAETMDTYGHLFPDSEEHGRGALDSVLRDPVVPPACPQRGARSVT